MSDLNINSTYGVVIVQDYKAVYVDENYARIFGYESAGELLSSIDSFLDLIAPELRDQARKNYTDIISGSVVPRGHTFSNVNRKGNRFTVFSIDHVIEWEGRPALQVTVIDMSMVEEANRRIKETNKKFENLIMNSGQGILIHRNFKPLLVNEAWVKLMRAESIEFVMARESILDRVLPEFREQAQIRNRQALSGELDLDGKSNVFENICYDGTKLFFNVYDNLIEWDGEPAIQVVLEDVTERIELQRQLVYRASHDELTDLYNRSAVYDALDKNSDNLNSMGCVLFDIDDFKFINDSYGHFIGDEVIRVFAQVMQEVLQDCEIYGRWGGEEFIAFVPNQSFEAVVGLAEKIRLEFRKRVFNAKSQTFVSSVSGGVSYLSGDDARGLCGERIEHMLREADQYLYRAKADGKNQIRW